MRGVGASRTVRIVHSSLSIFGPVFVLAGWTMLVLIGMAVGRLSATFKRQLRPEDFALGESSAVPERLRVVNRNYMNLLELPVLFYAITVIAFVTNAVSPLIVGLAWAYVLLRVLHSLIHATYNHVLHRMIAFALSNVTLATLWILVGRALLR